MVNVGYHAARLQAKLMRSLYTKRIAQIVRTPISQTRKVPIAVYAFSCERDLPEQVASLRSFLRYVGIPNQFTVISDGSYTDESCDLLRRIHPCVEVIPIEKLMRTDLPQCLYDYAAQNVIGKKFSGFLSIPIKGVTIYLDSDILFFQGASDLLSLANLSNSGSPSALYLPDCAFKGDERLIYDESEKRDPVNCGFTIFNKTLDWSFALERLSKLKEFNHYFTEQTLVHLTMHHNQAKPLCSKRYVLSVEDQFIYPDKYAGKEIALRHYVSDVRHKFWLNVGI